VVGRNDTVGVSGCMNSEKVGEGVEEERVEMHGWFLSSIVLP